MHVTTVGLDLAKHVFQVHGIDQDGQVWTCSEKDTAGERARIFNPPVAGETGRPMIDRGGERPM
jgi:hypothetical protein